MLRIFILLFFFGSFFVKLIGFCKSSMKAFYCPTVFFSWNFTHFLVVCMHTHVLVEVRGQFGVSSPLLLCFCCTAGHSKLRSSRRALASVLLVDSSIQHSSSGLPSKHAYSLSHLCPCLALLN